MGDTEDRITLDALKSQGFSDEEIKAVFPGADPGPGQETPPAQPATPAQPGQPGQPGQPPDPQAEPSAQDPKPAQPTQPAGDPPGPAQPPGANSDPDDAKKHPPTIAYDRFKEVNDKNKMLAAELAALRATMPGGQPQAPRPVQPAPASIQQPVDNRQVMAKYYAAISQAADREARDIFGIDANEDLTALQFSDPGKYQSYLDARTSLVQQMDFEERRIFAQQQDNRNFISAIHQDPLFVSVYNFAKAEIDELPRKEARRFDEAEARVTAMRGSPEDLKYLWEELGKYKAKYLAKVGTPQGQPPADSAPNPAPFQTQPPANSAPLPANPLDKAVGLPRANNLSGAKTAVTSWAQVEQLIREGKYDQIPQDMLKQIDPRLLE